MCHNVTWRLVQKFWICRRHRDQKVIWTFPHGGGAGGFDPASFWSNLPLPNRDVDVSHHDVVICLQILALPVSL